MQQRIVVLLERYISGSITDGELAELHQLFESSPQDVQAGIAQWLDGRETDQAYDPQHWQQVLGRIMNADRTEDVTVTPVIPFYKRPFFRYAAAAVVVLVAGAGFWFTNSNTKSTQVADQPVVVEKNVPPGKDGAILTLADGTQLVLDSLGNGLVSTQQGTHVVLNDGQLTYHSQQQALAAPQFNTMTTPRGRQFNVTLPDGTRVWLNASSSLRYPTVFGGFERRVEVTGEAFFEVAQNKDLPFIVNIGQQAEVQVLGTSFNVNAYADEPGINTTLLEGSVKVLAVKRNEELVLRPGEQAQQSDELQKKTVNVDDVVAWKNGAFNFNDMELPAVMRQLSRWYNVEIEYAGPVSKGKFGGKMGRNLSLADVLAELKNFDVNFRIEDGNKIVVLP
ncbi:MAG: FecR family protein [Pseudobacter sp.]|uniref:FecR family protein n=1 Tax=Pseudobacter sp. TaxID=2045420 RepID=UPI003F7EC50B